MYILFILICALIGAAGLYFLARPLYDQLEKYMHTWFDIGKLKVLLVTCQLVSSVSDSTGVAWSEPFHSVTKFLASLQVSPFQVMPTGVERESMIFHHHKH